MTRRPRSRKGRRPIQPADHEVPGRAKPKRPIHSIEGGGAVLAQETGALVRKGDPIEDPFATFWEWDTAEDEVAFANL
jgi:hypothetical protein